MATKQNMDEKDEKTDTNGMKKNLSKNMKMLFLWWIVSGK